MPQPNTRQLSSCAFELAPVPDQPVNQTTAEIGIAQSSCAGASATKSRLTLGRIALSV